MSYVRHNWTCIVFQHRVARNKHDNNTHVAGKVGEASSIDAECTFLERWICELSQNDVKVKQRQQPYFLWGRNNIQEQHQHKQQSLRALGILRFSVWSVLIRTGGDVPPSSWGGIRDTISNYSPPRLSLQDTTLRGRPTSAGTRQSPSNQTHWCAWVFPRPLVCRAREQPMRMVYTLKNTTDSSHLYTTELPYNVW